MKKAFKSLLGILLLLAGQSSFACSTYKLTSAGKTMVGMNYDAWFLKPRIWFETAGYGAAFTGANDQGGTEFTPQSGMNVHGLSFGTLATATPKNGQPVAGKKPISNRANYLKDILHRCKTVAEVKAYIEQYDHSTLAHDVFLYTDASGAYLVVEPYTLTLGTDDKYVLANFCPSTVSDLSTIKQERYVRGNAFLNTKTGTSLDFCTALSDTMHVCRPKIGDGTLLTSIWDLNGGKINLYFYHDYKNLVQFDLKEELQKGDHVLEIPALFPPTEEYQQLVNFKTPLNSSAVDSILRSGFLLFSFSTVYFGVSYLRRRKVKYAPYKLLSAALSFIMMYYMYVLKTEPGIFYFPAPYKAPGSTLVSMASYIPFLAFLTLIPLLYINGKLFRERVWHPVSRGLFTLNNMAVLGLVGLFAYWGLYNIF